jgi:hypothetical protein
VALAARYSGKKFGVEMDVLMLKVLGDAAFGRAYLLDEVVRVGPRMALVRRKRDPSYHTPPAPPLDALHHHHARQQQEAHTMCSSHTAFRT